MNMNEIVLSPLGKTWILDLDGTLVKHNGYILDGRDSLLNGADEFIRNIPQTDMIILLTSRKDEQRELTEEFLAQHQIRYNHIIFNAPLGERILVNDKKPSGLRTAIAVNTERDEFCKVKFSVDDEL